MYRAFNLQPVEFNTSYIDDGSQLNDANASTVEATLDSFIADGRIDGSRLQHRWFPELDADVFISHSHRDQTNAKNLAGYLHSCHGLSAFIDSCVWGHADDLLRQFDNDYCRNERNNNYSYERRNGSTSHVHMMLATALTEMLDRCECVIFMNTPNSISSKDAVTKTHSPWVYFELGMIRLLKAKTPRRLLKESSVNMSGGTVKAKLPTMDYSVDLSRLTEIDHNTLNGWERLKSRALGAVHSLDLLYQAAPKQ